MNLIQKQIELEFKSSHHLESHVKEDLLNSGLEGLVKQYIDTLVNHINSCDYSYVTNDGTVSIWETKRERHENVLKMDLEKLAWKVITMCTVKPISTYTECIGRIRRVFNNPTDRQDLEQASECVALLSSINLINVVLPRNTEEGVLMVHSNIKYDGNLSDYLNNTRHVMPSLLEPVKVTSNNCSGYRTFNSSLILGGKHHDKHVPYDHINRMNSVALSIDTRAIQQEPVFKEKDGETAAEREERYGNWKQFNNESMKVYAELVASGNKFYLTHKYDERLRSYSHGYHVHTQGDQFRKSVTELANKEVVCMG